MTVDVGQRLMKVVLIGPVGDLMYIQEDVLPFLQNDESFIF